MELTPEYLAENEDVIRRSTLYVMKGHDPDRYGGLVRFAQPFQSPTARILSVGCSGYEPILYHATHALDVLPLAHDYLKENGWTGEFVAGSVTALPWPDKFFDCAICSEVVEHLPADEDVLDAFREIDRVAKNWLITTPASPIPEHTHKRFWPIEAASKYAADFGANIIRVNLWWFISKSSSVFDVEQRAGPAPPFGSARSHVHHAKRAPGLPWVKIGV